MSTNRITAIRQRVERATKPAPTGECVCKDDSGDCEPCSSFYDWDSEQRDATGKLVVLDVPWLLSRLEAAERVIQAAREFANPEKPQFDDLTVAIVKYDRSGGGE